MAYPVTIVASGGYPVVQVSGIDGATPMTPVASGGFPITLVTGDAKPVCLVNEDNTEWSE